MAVGGNVACRVLASEGAGLVVESETVVRLLALNEAEAVGAVAAGDDLRGEAGDSANLAGDVGDVVTGELEASVLDAVVLAEVKLADVDVLVLGWVGSRAAAVCWVGAAGSLGCGSCEGSTEESSGNSEVLHLCMDVC